MKAMARDLNETDVSKNLMENFKQQSYGYLLGFRKE